MITIQTLDLNFQGKPLAVACYLLPHSGGAALVECGPGSTREPLVAALARFGYSPGDVTDVLLTHIHLDHAGAAGWLARQGARIHVHPLGAPHLANPEKLLSSATRIYGDRMDALWGEFLPVPESRLVVVEEGQPIQIGEFSVLPVDTPGHANHHFAYVLGDLCFTGDVGGVRIPGRPYLRIPMPPPEFHLETWRQSVAKLRALGFSRIAPTHFGIYDDAAWHLDALEAELDAAEAFILEVMPANPSIETLKEKLSAWAAGRAAAIQVGSEALTAFELANPTWMSAAGIERYWRKFRQAN